MDVTTQLLKAHLKQLRLPAMVAELEKLSREAAASNQSYEQFLLQLTEFDLASRAANALTSRINQAGFPVARNTPYAGGYSLDRHGAPRKGIHALQVEIDRSLYLDSGLGETGEGLPTTQALVTQIFDALCEDAEAIQRPIAAE